MILPKDLPAPADRYPVRTALLSVFDKTDLVPFATRLAALGVRLLSTGGTARALREAGLAVTDVAEVTGYPEMMDGRVKTLHPLVHGGLLARRNDTEDLESLERHGGTPIDLVVVNLYPFRETISRPDVTESEAVENIDIGGPAMIRAAAKNFVFVAVVTSPDQYEGVVTELESHDGSLGVATRRRLAARAFERTAGFDTAIAGYLAGRIAPHTEEAREIPSLLDLHLRTEQALRYGENPHQQAALYGDTSPYFQQLHGKELSFNNLLDLNAALRLIDEFRGAAPTCAILKHTNPCGVGTAPTLADAYNLAFATDTQSPFGGIVVVNRPLEMATAEAVDSIFTELIIAPEFEEGVLDFLQRKKNRRLIRSLEPARTDRSLDLRSVVGGMLAQQQDAVLPPLSAMRQAVRCVTRRGPSEQEWGDLDLAWRVAKHVKSNAIVYVREGATIGIGAGQMSRVDASEIAVSKGRKSGLSFSDSVLASDAFFPFPDGLIAAAEAGARAVIQPGGSIRDEDVIRAADEREMAMIFTGKRHFRH